MSISIFGRRSRVLRFLSANRGTQNGILSLSITHPLCVPHIRMLIRSHKDLLFSKYTHSHYDCRMHAYTHRQMLYALHICECVSHLLHVLLFLQQILLTFFLLLVIIFCHSLYFSPHLVFLWHFRKTPKKTQNEMKQNENSFFNCLRMNVLFYG